jgi:hypothetical protein
MADVNNIIIDNTIIDYSTINNMISILRELQTNINDFKNKFAYGDGNQINSFVNLSDMKVEGQQKPLEAGKATIDVPITFKSNFTVNPTVTITAETTNTNSKQPVITFTRIATDLNKITVHVTNMDTTAAYRLNILATGI